MLLTSSLKLNYNNNIIQQKIMDKPTTVIRATHSHVAKAMDEFSFEKEDCFYMVGGGNSEAREFIQVIHPKSRKLGLVPARKFEFVQTTALNPTPHSSTKTKNVLAYVTETCYKMTNGDLEASKGDPILILEDICSNFYFAKLIGKVGAPGRIPKCHVELQEEIASNNQPRVLRNNSTGNITRPEKPVRTFTSRRTESNPDVPDANSQYLGWGVLGSELSLSNPQVCDETISESSVVLDTIPISAIKIIRGVVVDSRPTIELGIYFCDNSSRTILRDAVAFKKLQIKLLEAFPKEAGLSGSSRVLPYMPQLGRSTANMSMNKAMSMREVNDFNLYFKDLLEVNALLPRCRALLDFVSPGSQDIALNRHNMKKYTSRPQQSLTVRNPTESSPLAQSPESNSSIISSVPALSSSPTSSCESEKELPSPPPTNIKIKLKVQDDLMAFWMKSNELTYPALLAKVSDRTQTQPKLLTYSHPSLPGQYKVANQKDLDTCLMLTKNKPIFSLP